MHVKVNKNMTFVLHCLHKYVLCVIYSIYTFINIKRNITITIIELQIYLVFMYVSKNILISILNHFEMILCDQKPVITNFWEKS